MIQKGIDNLRLRLTLYGMGVFQRKENGEISSRGYDIRIRLIQRAHKTLNAVEGLLGKGYE